MSTCPKCGATWAPDHDFCPRDGTRLVADSEAPTASGGAAGGGAEMPVVGEVLEGKYELLRLIGEGGSGVVFEARHLSIGRPVAIKVLKPGFVGDETQFARFAEEARLTAKIDHYGIVEILDLVTPPDRSPYIVMELLEGESLAALIERQGSLAPARAIRIAMGILEALAAAHRHGIVHRDVKPGNVFIAREQGRGEVIKLFDFGIARAEQDSPRLTLPGRAVGTAVFMPPEQLMSSDVDHRADLYAVAAVLYLALTGEHPFEGSAWSALASAKLSNAIRPMKRLEGPIAKKLEQVVRHGLELDPDDRPQSADEYREELEMALAAIEEQSRVRTSVEPTVHLAEKPRVAVIPFAVSPPGHREAWAGEALGLSLFDLLASRPGQRLSNPDQVSAALHATLHGERSDPAAIGHQVGAGYVVTGSIELGGLDVRVETKVVEVDTGEVLARRVQTGELENIFALNAATLENAGRAFKLAPAADSPPPVLAEVDFAALREYAELDRMSRRDADARSPDLLRRTEALLDRYPDHLGLRFLRAATLLRRFEGSEAAGDDLGRAHGDLEVLAARGTADPRVGVARARLRHAERFFDPAEAMVLTEEQRALSGFDARVLLEQASALENLGLPVDAAELLSAVTGHDRACGPALVRLATLWLGPPQPGAARRSGELAAFVLRSARLLRDEELADRDLATSARHGWAPLPDLSPLDALLAARQGDAAAMAAAIERSDTSASFFSLAAVASARCLVDPSDHAAEQMLDVVRRACALLDRTPNHEVCELVYAMPEAWIPALEQWHVAHPEHRRLRFLAGLAHERIGDLDGAIAIVGEVAGSAGAATLGDVARRHLARLQGRVAAT